MKKYIKYIIYMSIATIMGFGFYKKIYIPKHTFKTLKATKGSIGIKVNGVGNVGARDTYKIGSLYGGKVLDFTIQEGEYIEKKSLIANIDSVDLADKIDEQRALEAKLLSDINSLKVDRLSAKVDFDYQKELFDKNRKLYKLHSISSLDYQKYLTSKDIAKLKIQSVDAHIVSLKNQIKQVRANINGLGEKLARYIITSPISGYITRKIVAPYQIITPNQTLIEMVNSKDIWVKTFVDTRMSGKVKIGDKASIKLRSSDKKYRGKVVNINPINNPVTYEREIDVAFDNLPIPFYLEEQAVVSIDITTLKDVVKIPAKILTIYKEKNGVWTLVGNKVKFKPLKVLGRQNKSVAVRGIDVDDKLIVQDPKKTTLKDGIKIYHD